MPGDVPAALDWYASCCPESRLQREAPDGDSRRDSDCDSAPQHLDRARRRSSTARPCAAFDEAELPFLVGGAYAYARYTGIDRHTKDFDVFVRPRDFDRALEAFAAQGVADRAHLLPLAGQGVPRGRLRGRHLRLRQRRGPGGRRTGSSTPSPETVLDYPARLIPAEEMIWSKSFIMERERFDGADVAHVLRSRAGELDWDRLLRRFEPQRRLAGAARPPHPLRLHLPGRRAR